MRKNDDCLDIGKWATQGVFEFSSFGDRKMETRSLGEVEEREQNVVALVSDLEIWDGGTPMWRHDWHVSGEWEPQVSESWGGGDLWEQGYGEREGGYWGLDLRKHLALLGPMGGDAANDIEERPKHYKIADAEMPCWRI